jgi:glucans biosynthesis protein
MPFTFVRGWVSAALVLCMAAAAAQERPTHPFEPAWLIDRAEKLAAEEHVDRAFDRRNALHELSYDQYRAIEFQRGASIWNREARGFTVDLFHPGFLFNVPVQINLVVGGISRRVLYTTDIFKYGLDTGPMQDVPAPGYAGFRVAATLNRPEVFDEFLVFQGASYFRAVGRNERYGLSARGLAVNTAKAPGEEFPVFSEFWIARPEVGAEQIVIHALLESPSVTGAYTFKAAAGDPTVIIVDCVLFPRVDVASYGVAPLTSMFLFDATNRIRFDDFRPAVHDSDGLSVLSGNGEYVWRALANPVALQVSAFAAVDLRGFGLMQRHREFAAFEDIEARYELRPSLWIEPVGEWGEGHVELVEIPSDEEIHDNIVAFWQPAEPMLAGRRYEFSYRMYWGHGLLPTKDAPARIVETRAGQALRRSEYRQFAVDFSAETIPEDLEVVAGASAGAIVDARGLVVEAAGTYRVNFMFDPQGADLAELRLELLSAGERWGETWLYRWTR